MEFAWDINLLEGYPYRIFNQKSTGAGFREQLRTAPSLLAWALKKPQTPLLLIGWFAEFVWLIWLMRIIAGAPIMVFGDNTPAYHQKSGWRAALLRWLLHRTDAVFYVGQRNHEFWRGLGVAEEKLFFTPHSIDNERFAADFRKLAPQRRALCQQFGIDPDLPVFLFCGKLIPKKRPLELLDAFLEAGLQAHAQLVYVGNGELYSELESRILLENLDAVHLLGFFNQSQMPLAYVLGEMLCLISSEEETWGLVVNEALACGRPVLISDRVGCGPDLVSPENGWIVPFDHPEKLSLALAEALRISKWTEMGRTDKARLKVILFHTWWMELEVHWIIPSEFLV